MARWGSGRPREGSAISADDVELFCKGKKNIPETTIMKKRAVKRILAVLTAVALFGCGSVAAQEAPPRTNEINIILYLAPGHFAESLFLIYNSVCLFAQERS